MRKVRIVILIIACSTFTLLQHAYADPPPGSIITIEIQNHTKVYGLRGGGIVYNEQYILTAAHVVSDISAADSYKMYVYPSGSNQPLTISAEAIIIHPSLDLALIKINDSTPGNSYVQIAGSINVLDKVFVVGRSENNTYSLVMGPTLVEGFNDSFIIVNNGKLGIELFDINIISTQIIKDLFINSGDSGSPLFNTKGELIGVAIRVGEKKFDTPFSYILGIPVDLPLELTSNNSASYIKLTNPDIKQWIIDDLPPFIVPLRIGVFSVI